LFEIEGVSLLLNDLAFGDRIDVRDALEDVISSGPVEHGLQGADVRIRFLRRTVGVLEPLLVVL